MFYCSIVLLFCILFHRWARPSWQDEAVQAYFDTATAAGTLPFSELFNATGRGFPDVSAQGTNYAVINNGHTNPAVAGIFSDKDSNIILIS